MLCMPDKCIKKNHTVHQSNITDPHNIMDFYLYTHTYMHTQSDGICSLQFVVVYQGLHKIEILQFFLTHKIGLD